MSLFYLINHPDTLITIIFCLLAGSLIFQYNVYYQTSLINIVVIIFLSVVVFFIFAFFIAFAE